MCIHKGQANLVYLLFFRLFAHLVEFNSNAGLNSSFDHGFCFGWGCPNTVAHFEAFGCVNHDR